MDDERGIHKNSADEAVINTSRLIQIESLTHTVGYSVSLAHTESNEIANRV